MRTHVIPVTICHQSHQAITGGSVTPDRVLNWIFTHQL